MPLRLLLVPGTPLLPNRLLLRFSPVLRLLASETATLTRMAFVSSAAPLAYDDAAERRHLALREDFLLDPEVVFLNHGSFGACPRPVFERYQSWQRELELRPVEFLGRRVSDLLTEARAPLAAYL